MQLPLNLAEVDWLVLGTVSTETATTSRSSRRRGGGLMFERQKIDRRCSSTQDNVRVAARRREDPGGRDGVTSSGVLSQAVSYW